MFEHQSSVRTLSLVIRQYPALLVVMETAFLTPYISSSVIAMLWLLHVHVCTDVDIMYVLLFHPACYKYLSITMPMLIWWTDWVIVPCIWHYKGAGVTL